MQAVRVRGDSKRTETHKEGTWLGSWNLRRYLEVAVHHELGPLGGDVEGQGVGVRKGDVIEARAAFVLCHAFVGWHGEPVVEEEHDSAGAEGVQAGDGPDELGLQEVVPGGRVVGAHDLDVAIDDARGNVGGVRRLGGERSRAARFEGLCPARVDCHGLSWHGGRK
jgi:hypothetical protein